MPAAAQEIGGLESKGAITLFKFAKAIGRESYVISQRDHRIELQDNFLFTDRGTPVPLRTTFVADGRLEPLRLRTEGSTSRTSSVQDDLEVRGDVARLLRGGLASKKAFPAGGFLIDGYSPVAMQELLLRFWQAHGRPATIPVLPAGGLVRIRPAEGMEVPASGVNANASGVNAKAASATQTLIGYTISGLIWGEESVWTDSTGALIALVGTDAEFDHFEAVREGYEGSLPRFIARAAASELADLAALGAAERSQPTGRLAIVGATLIDGRGGAPVPDSVVLVEDGRIRAVGREGQVAVPAGATVLDAHGKWLLPGLWDMHAHVEQVEWGPIYLASGVTTVRDCGNEFDFITSVRDAIAGGRGLGPRILIAGIVDGSGPQSLGAVIADTPEQARAVVARYKAAGALQIKLYSSIKPELVPVFAAAAHRLGMTVTGHVPTGMTTTQAVQAGMDAINHVQYPTVDLERLEGFKPDSRSIALRFDTPAARAMLGVFQSHGTVFDPTLAIYELMLHARTVPVASFEPGVTHVAPELRQTLEGGGAPAGEAAGAQSRFAAMVAMVGALHRAGLPIVAGTDQAVPGYSLDRELALYVEAGLTPMEAIATATRVPAEVMGLAAEVGTVETGKRADLVLLDADPLADIRAMRRVWRTIAAGAVYEPAPLWRSVGFTP